MLFVEHKYQPSKKNLQLLFDLYPGCFHLLLKHKLVNVSFNIKYTAYPKRIGNHQYKTVKFEDFLKLNNNKAKHLNKILG
jgi:hypothetical protein